jgi:hypothetical protein
MPEGGGIYEKDCGPSFQGRPDGVGEQVCYWPVSLTSAHICVVWRDLVGVNSIMTLAEVSGRQLASQKRLEFPDILVRYDDSVHSAPPVTQVRQRDGSSACVFCEAVGK